MKRFLSPALMGMLTVATTVWVLVQGVLATPLLLFVAVGAPLTVLLLVRAIADPEHEARRPWLSLILGATIIPIVVIALHGVFLALGYTLVSPFVDPARDVWEQLRADPDLFRVLTSGWAIAIIIQLAVVAPLAEETTKPFAALVRRPRTAREAFLFGAAAGTGFAMIENVMYASGWLWGPLDNWLPVAVTRMLGAGLHAFGAAFVAWGMFQLRNREPGRWGRFGRSYLFALTAHGLWNGSAAVTIVLFGARATGGLRARGDAFAWGVVLMVFLGLLGVVITGALLIAARRVANGETPLRVLPVEDAGTPEGIAAWALVSSTVLIPMVILVLVYPNLVAL